LGFIPPRHLRALNRGSGKNEIPMAKISYREKFPVGVMAFVTQGLV